VLNINLMREQWKRTVPFFLVITLFVIPISSTLKSIFIPLSLIGILSIPAFRNDIACILKEHWSKAAIAFFLVVLFACVWSPADPHLRLTMLGKYSKFLYLPIFVVCFTQPTVRQYGIYAFVLAMIITCVVSISNAQVDMIFHNHIVTSFMMAFAAYISGIEAMRSAGLKRVFFVFLVLLFSYQLLFINQGRSGYILYVVLMFLLMVMYLPSKYLFGAILFFSCSFVMIMNHSKILSTRIHALVEDIHLYKHGEKNTSLGTRIVFHKFAKSLFLTSPWIGHGSGGFAYAFQHREHRELVKGWDNLLDPHSQYWLVAADFGLLGLGALFYLFVSLWIAALRLKHMKSLMLGLLLSCFLANFTDSLLFYSAVGNLFIVFSALSLGELVEQKKNLAAENTLETPLQTISCPTAS